MIITPFPQRKVLGYKISTGDIWNDLSLFLFFKRVLKLAKLLGEKNIVPIQVMHVEK